MMAAANESDIS